jgi:hypothetical protein
MKKRNAILGFALVGALWSTVGLCAQEATPSGTNAGGQESAAGKDANPQSYSGMYTFLKDGEFVQITVEDQGRVTGFISRYGDGDSDKGAFLNQFFRSGSLEGSKLKFTTEMVHGVSFDFKGTVERGEGKAPGDEAYFVLKGTLIENASDVNKKVTSHTRDVAFKLFPQDATPSEVMRK